MRPLWLLVLVISVAFAAASCSDDGVAGEGTPSAPTDSSLASVVSTTSSEPSTTTTVASEPLATTTATDHGAAPFASGWRQASNGFGARVVAYSNTLGLVAIDDRGVVWWSAEGVVWEATNSGNPLADTDFIAVTAGGPGFLAVAVDRPAEENTAPVPMNPRVWISSDGRIWDRPAEGMLVAPPSVVFINSVAASPAGVLITESEGGYWRSSDGLTWERYESEELIATGGTLGFAAVQGTGCEVVLSTDGRSFEPTGWAGVSCCPGVTSVFYEGSRIVVAWCSGAFETALIDTSVDSGLTWTEAQDDQCRGLPVSLTESPELGVFAAFKTADSRLALLHSNDGIDWSYVPLVDPVPAPSQLLAAGTRLFATMWEEGQPAQEMWVWFADESAR